MPRTVFTKEAPMKHHFFPTRRRVLQGIAAFAAAGALAAPAFAAEAPLKIGLIPAAHRSVRIDRQADRGRCRLYIAKNGDTVAGRKVELIVKDDTGLRPRRPSASRRRWSCRTR
jgi:branched-chain amino acid transport system substrate-binding protein